MSEIICPNCGNKEHIEEPHFCQKCGTCLHNHCTNPTCPVNDVEEDELNWLPQNALYCPICGEKTTFFEFLN